MAITIPRYDGAQVKSIGISTPKAQGVASPLVGLGQSIQKVEENIWKSNAIDTEIANKQKQQEVKRLSFEFSTTMSDQEQQSKFGTSGNNNIEGQEPTSFEGFFALKGTEAEEFKGAYLEDFKTKIFEAIPKNLDPETKLGFEKMAQERINSVTNSYNERALSQQIFATKAASGAMQASIMRDISLYAFDDKRFDEEIGKLKLVIRTDVEDNFGNDENSALVLKSRLEKDVSDAYSKRLAAMAETDPKKALAFLVNNSGGEKSPFNGDAIGQYKPKLEKLVAYEDGTTTAEIIFNRNMPNTMNKSIDVESMRKELKASGLTDEAKTVAEKRIEERSRELKADRAERVSGYIDNLWQRIDDKGLNETTALKSIDTADLPGDTRVQLKKQVESHFRPPVDTEARFLKYMGEMENLAELQEKINSGEIRVQSLKDGLRYAGDIGRGNVAKLVSYGKNYEKALASPAMAPGQFDLVVEELKQSGVKDIPKKGTPEYKAMQATLLDEMVTKQTATGKILDDVGVKNEFRRIITTKVPVNTATTLFGKRLWGGVDEKRQWEIENKGAVDITGLLRASLKREPTREEIATAKAAYEKKSSRRELKTRAVFGPSVDGGY